MATSVFAAIAPAQMFKPRKYQIASIGVPIIFLATITGVFMKFTQNIILISILKIWWKSRSFPES